jgi:hypothetical protein
LERHTATDCETSDELPQVRQRRQAIRMLVQQAISLGVYHQDNPVSQRLFDR